MTAETLTARQAASTVPARRHDGAGLLQVAYGKYSVAANVEDGDIFEMCKVPAGALVVDGKFWCSDMDTGTEALDMDVGWADNGGASATFTDASGTTWTNMGSGSASATGFVNAGILSGDAVTDLLPAGNLRFFDMKAGPVYFSKETKIQVEANVAAAAFAAGTVYVVVYYVVP